MKLRPLLKIIESGSILTNLFLFGYLFLLHEIIYDFFFHDTLQEISGKAIFENITNIPLGIFLIGLIFAEVFAYYWKSRSSRFGSEASGGVFLLWMFHAVIAVIMTTTALTLLGYNFDNSVLVMSAALFLTVIKELVIFAIVVTAEEVEDVHALPKWKSYLSDFIFALFYSLAYTIVIGNILEPKGYENYLLAAWYAKPLMLMNLFITVLLFFMLYLPLRMGYFIFEKVEGRVERILSKISVMFVALAVIIPHFEGEVSLEDALKDPESVEILFLNSRSLEKVSAEIGKLKNLNALHLGYNKLTDLPPELSKLGKLKWLSLEGNMLREIPFVIAELESLEELNIRYNRIEKFPENLSPFRKLKSIGAGLNRIKSAEKLRVERSLVKGRVKWK